MHAAAIRITITLIVQSFPCVSNLVVLYLPCFTIINMKGINRTHIQGLKLTLFICLLGLVSYRWKGWTSVDPFQHTKYVIATIKLLLKNRQLATCIQASCACTVSWGHVHIHVILGSTKISMEHGFVNPRRMREEYDSHLCVCLLPRYLVCNPHVRCYKVRRRVWIVHIVRI
jgi:hypothetical protein